MIRTAGRASPRGARAATAGSLTIALLGALTLAAASARADVTHAPGPAAAAWAAYLEFAFTGDEAALLRVVQAQGESSFVAFEQALVAARRGDRAGMVERAERAVALDPSNGEAQALLARAWLRMADEGLGSIEALRRGTEHAEAASRLGAADPEIYDRLAAARGVLAASAEREGNDEEALRQRGMQRAALETWATRLHHDVAWRQLADLARDLGDLPGEAEALRELARRGDDDLLATQRLGDVLAELGRCEAALPLLESALGAADADNYAAISIAVQLGDCAQHAGEHALAERAFRRALELDPTNLIAVSGLAEALWQQGRRAEALAALDAHATRLAGTEAGGTRRPGADAEQRLDWLATRARWLASHGVPGAADEARRAIALAGSTGTPRQRALMQALLAEGLMAEADAAGAVEAARAGVEFDPSHEPALLALLNALWARGDRQELVAEIARLEKKAPGAAWLMRLARWQAAHGIDAGARRHARRALELFAGPPGARAEFEIDAGEALLAAGEPDRAEQLARSALALRPWDRSGAFLLARSLVQLGRSDEATTELAAFIAARGEDPWLLEEQSEFESARRRHDEAIRLAKRSIELLGASAHAAEHARCSTRLGEALLAADRPADAVEALAFIEKLPAPSTARVLLASDAMRRSGQSARALALVERALAVAPDDPGLRFDRGRSLLDLGRVEEGVAVMKALAADRSVPGRHGQIALALAQAGSAEADTLALEGMALYPRHAGSALSAARAAERLGRRADAEARFRRALEIEPDSAVVLNSLGYSLADWNVKLDEATRLLRRAVELRPHEAAYLDSLAWALHRTGKHDEAARFLEAAIARDRDAVIVAHLGHVRLAQGRVEDARALLTEALAHRMDEGAEQAREALAGLPPVQTRAAP